MAKINEQFYQHYSYNMDSHIFLAVFHYAHKFLTRFWVGYHAGRHVPFPFFFLSEKHHVFIFLTNVRKFLDILFPWLVLFKRTPLTLCCAGVLRRVSKIVWGLQE